MIRAFLPGSSLSFLCSGQAQWYIQARSEPARRMIMSPGPRAAAADCAAVPRTVQLPPVCRPPQI
jgi:hypothetical protein